MITNYGHVPQCMRQSCHSAIVLLGIPDCIISTHSSEEKLSKWYYLETFENPLFAAASRLLKYSVFLPTKNCCNFESLK